ncbi:MAG: hypothetical protein DI539_20485 [Flavobacterium psychrophilum]|nr:MAG: hypothetical protein DI539_20485 [Flavobacterium psychrophilum]
MRTYKSILRFFLTGASALVLLLSFSGCNGTEPSPFRKTLFEALKDKTWTLKNVTVNDVDKTGLYLKDMTLVFGGDFNKSDFTYTTTNGGKVWPASGKWEFVTDTQVKRDDGVVIDLKEWVVTSLKMEFVWAGSTSYGGRTESTSGKHVMQFAAQ